MLFPLLLEIFQRSYNLLQLIGFSLVAILLQVDTWITCPGHFEDMMASAYTWFAKKACAYREYLPKPYRCPWACERFQRFVEGHVLPSLLHTWYYGRYHMSNGHRFALAMSLRGGGRTGYFWGCRARLSVAGGVVVPLPVFAHTAVPSQPSASTAPHDPGDRHGHDRPSRPAPASSLCPPPHTATCPHTVR